MSALFKQDLLGRMVEIKGNPSIRGFIQGVFVTERGVFFLLEMEDGSIDEVAPDHYRYESTRIRFPQTSCVHSLIASATPEPCMPGSDNVVGDR